jgi:hypothetical protein
MTTSNCSELGKSVGLRLTDWFEGVTQPEYVKPEAPHFTLDEMQRIIAAAQEPFKTFYWLAAETGMRLGGTLDEPASRSRSKRRTSLQDARPIQCLMRKIRTASRYCGGGFSSFFCCSALAFSACCFSAFDCAAVGDGGCAVGGCEG